MSGISDFNSFPRFQFKCKMNAFHKICYKNMFPPYTQVPIHIYYVVRLGNISTNGPLTLKNGQKYMVEMAMFNVQSAKVGKPES